MLTATTYIRPYKVAAGKGAVQTLEERFDYGLNPKKLGALSSYLCDPATAPAEFLLVKSQYQAETGRNVERGALFFQIRQAFLPGEVTAEEANRIGYESTTRRICGPIRTRICRGIGCRNITLSPKSHPKEATPAPMKRRTIATQTTQTKEITYD